MTNDDLHRLKSFVGLPHLHHYDPHLNAGDCEILEQKLMSDGWSITIRCQAGRSITYMAMLNKTGVDGVMAEAGDRRSALCAAALSVAK